MHISFCFLLIKKSVMTDTISRAAALCLAMGLACLQVRGLGAGEYQGTSLGPATHIAGERGRGLDGFLTLPSLLLFTSSHHHRGLQLKQSSSPRRNVLICTSCSATGWETSPAGRSCTGRMRERCPRHPRVTDLHLKLSQDCPRNCSRLLQWWLACLPPGLLSCSTSSSFLNLGFPTARPFSSCLAFFPSTPT